MLLVPISDREFNVYALSLPTGPNFGPVIFRAGWKTRDGRAAGAMFFAPESRTFSVIVLRRRTDYCFVSTHSEAGFASKGDALEDLASALEPAEAMEPVPPSVKKRRPLLKATGKGLGEHFKLLTGTLTHIPALMAIGEVYLAMPRPDDNFVPDFQTGNFDSRLFELYLLAAFREQGITVSQDQISPDFFIQCAGQECYVEAVTTNPKDVRIQGHAWPTFAPEDHEERLLGSPAARFAKTLRSKLQRAYENLPHVQGKPFALAIADFHAPSSMVWSREALPSYLYGVYPHVADGPGGPVAVGSPVKTLLGKDSIPAGLFRNPEMSHLSAVIFSNAVTLGKFNRMGYLAGFRPNGLKMIREGILFDRTPGALEAIPFKLDILSDEYAALWEGGEAWCQELEVYHNPLAAHPIDFSLLPGATHTFEINGELLIKTIWENSVISSITDLRLER
jgi:hypothetical protein